MKVTLIIHSESDRMEGWRWFRLYVSRDSVARMAPEVSADLDTNTMIELDGAEPGDELRFYGSPVAGRAFERIFRVTGEADDTAYSLLPTGEELTLSGAVA